MNDSETDHAQGSAVFQNVISGILPAKLTDSIKVHCAQLSTERARSTLSFRSTMNIRPTKESDSRNVHSHSRSFTIIHNKNSERSEEPSPFPQKGLRGRAKSAASDPHLPVVPLRTTSCHILPPKTRVKPLR